jgi:aminocyclitol acetyltransferase
MKTRLEQVLDRCLNGREVAVWGNPTRPLMRALSPYGYHIAGAVDPAKHFVVAVNEADMDDFFEEEQAKTFQYPDDCLVFEDEGGELPFEWTCHGVPVGRQTYFGEGIAGACANGYMAFYVHQRHGQDSSKPSIRHDIHQRRNRKLFYK